MKVSTERLSASERMRLIKRLAREQMADDASRRVWSEAATVRSCDLDTPSGMEPRPKCGNTVGIAPQVKVGEPRAHVQRVWYASAEFTTQPADSGCRNCWPPGPLRTLETHRRHPWSALSSLGVCTTAWSCC